MAYSNSLNEPACEGTGGRAWVLKSSSLSHSFLLRSASSRRQSFTRPMGSSMYSKTEK